MGCDHISPFILKNCADIICEPVCKLFSLCLVSSCLPNEWKIHKIQPVFKKGNRSLVCNYRPISLLCILSKALEWIIYKPFLRTKICKEQLSGRSCLTQLLASYEKVFESVILSSWTSVKPLIRCRTKSFSTSFGDLVSPAPCGFGLERTYQADHILCLLTAHPLVY